MRTLIDRLRAQDGYFTYHPIAVVVVVVILLFLFWPILHIGPFALLVLLLLLLLLL